MASIAPAYRSRVPTPSSLPVRHYCHRRRLPSFGGSGAAKPLKVPVFTMLPLHGKENLCRGSTVVVAGAGNSAGQAAMFSRKTRRKCSWLVRGEGLTKVCRIISRVGFKAKENIEILTHTEIRRMMGGKSLEAIELENTKTGENEPCRCRLSFDDWRKTMHSLVAAGNQAR